MANIPTVKTKSGDSYAIINESDFDPEVHKLYEDSADAKKPSNDEQGAGGSEAEKPKPRASKGKASKG